MLGARERTLHETFVVLAVPKENANCDLLEIMTSLISKLETLHYIPGTEDRGQLFIITLSRLAL